MNFNFFSKKKAHDLVIILVFVLLVAKTVFFNSLLPIAISPDYTFYHLAIAQAYSKIPKVLIVHNIKQIKPFCKYFPVLAPVTVHPNLYASITGKLVWLFSILGFSDSIRWANLTQTIFGLLTIYFIYKTSKEIVNNKVFNLFVLIITSSISMFVYLINYFSYDNWINLMSILSIYHSLRFIKYSDVKHAFYLTIFILLGALSKNTIGPLAVLVGLIVFLKIITSYDDIRTSLVSNFTKSSKVMRINFLLLFFTALFLFITNLYFYRLEIFKPWINFSFEECRLMEQNYCVSRSSNEVNKIVRERTIKRNKSSAFQQAKKTLENTQKKNSSNLMSIITYFPKWEKYMEERTFNITSHKSINKPQKINNIYHWLIVASVILFILFYRWKNKELNILIVYAVGYLLFLLIAVNYKFYLNTGDFNYALQGRYAFPVLGPIIILFVYSFWQIPLDKKKIINVIVLTFISIFFLFGDNYYLLTRYKRWAIAQPSLSHEFGHTKLISLGNSSPFQKIKINNQDKNLAVYVSTFIKKIPNDKFTIEIYDSSCNKKLKVLPLKHIKDNDYALVNLPKNLNKKDYCFRVTNEKSQNPIVLWFSAKDLPGNLFSKDQGNTLDKDLVYYLISDEAAKIINRPF